MTGEQLHTIGDVGQWLAVFFLVIGIGIMLSNGVGTGTVLISVGSLVLVISTKVKYYGRRHKDTELAEIKRKSLKMTKEG